MAKKKNNNKKSPKEETTQPVETTQESAQEVSREPEAVPEPNGATEDKPSETVEDVQTPEPSAPMSEPSVTQEPPKIDEPPEAPPAPAPAPKKRLTLQERLALATKSQKSTKRTSSAPVSASSAEPTSKTASPEPTELASSPAPSINVNPVSLTAPATAPTPPVSTNGSVSQSRGTSMEISRPEPTLFPANFKDLPLDDLHKLITDSQNKFMMLESKTKSLTEEKQSLQDKVKTMSSSMSRTPTTQQQQLPSASLLKEKDDKIAALMREGEELSKKELKFNNTIKKLKAREAEADYEIQNLMNKLSTLESESKKNKEALKKSLEAEQQSSNKTKTLQKQLEHEQSALKEEISKNEEVSHKLEEMSQTLVQEKNRFSKEINELKRTLEKEKSKLQMTKDDHSREVTRLESKIEQLRFQAENAQTTTSTNDEGYLKLLKQYDILQTQYTSTTENWQSIEASLMGKISALEDEVSSLNNKLHVAEQKITVLTKDLASKASELDSTTAELKVIKADKIKLENKLETTTKSLSGIEEVSETKEIKHNQERSALEYKIQSLERQLKETIQPQHLTVDNNSGLGIGTSPSFSSPLFSRNASAVSFKQRMWEGSRDSISFGESSTTPIQSRKASAAFPPPPPQEYFDGNHDDSLSDFGGDNDNESVVGSPIAYNTSRQDSYSSTTIGGGAGASVQLIGKMSSQVRRLQTEISTMREEMEKLTEDKKAANEEIVRLMRDNEQVVNFKNRIAQLEEEVEMYSQKNDKMLIILGEKSERVEELKADVDDLKDMLKQQVQQMIELQGK